MVKFFCDNCGRGLCVENTVCAEIAYPTKKGLVLLIEERVFCIPCSEKLFPVKPISKFEHIIEGVDE